MRRLRRYGSGFMGLGFVGEKFKDFKIVMKKFIKYLFFYKVLFVVVMVFVMLFAVFLIVGFKIFSKVIIKIFEGIMSKISGIGNGIDFEYVGKIILILLGLYIVSVFFGYIQGWIMLGILMKFIYRFRKEIL